MPTVYRSAMQAYIDNCRAANAYSSSAYPREYTSSHHQRPSDMSRRYPYPVEDRSRDDDRYYQRSSRPRGGSYRRPPPPPEPSRQMDPPPRRHRRPSTATTASTPSQAPPPRKSVRFTDGERPSSRRQSSGSQQPMRPKTFSTDAPPVAISESAKDTSRRLFHRRPSDGGRPSARPTVSRGDSTWTVNTTRAESGTTVGGGRRGERRPEREREYRGGRDSGRSRRR